MKKGIILLGAILVSSVSFLTAQTETINLEQKVGIFTTESLTLGEGTYQFNISNNNVGHDVGFVLVPKGKYNATDHIKEAYVKAPVGNNKSELTDIVKLNAGEYEYFCPLNPTEKYALTVVDNVAPIKLGQVPGTFTVKALTVQEGAFQFEIGNEGVNHDVGFVLVPKGKYDATDHITAAYVKAPVSNGSSSMTNIVQLEAGEYEYFCPLNPTPKYSLTVER